MKDHKKLEQLMLFSEVAEKLSFTAAAEKLDISRGHLSSQIRRLEKEMEMPLLVRSTRSVRLTAEGERVLAGMNKIKSDLLELQRSALKEGQEIEGVIKITSPRLFTERFLLDLCIAFKEMHPNVEFSINCSYTNFDLNRSNFDLAFRATTEPPQNMIAKQLYSYRQCCCASPTYFMEHGKPIALSDLPHHQCLRGQDQPVWQFKDQSIPVSGGFVVNDNNFLKKLALENKGIIKLPEYMVDDEVKSGRLIAIFDEHIPDANSIFMIHPQLIQQSKRMSTFIDFTQQYFKSMTTT